MYSTFDLLCLMLALAFFIYACGLEYRLRTAQRDLYGTKGERNFYKDAYTYLKKDVDYEAQQEWDWPSFPNKPFASWIRFARWPGNGEVISHRKTGEVKIQVKKSHLFNPGNAKAA